MTRNALYNWLTRPLAGLVAACALVAAHPTDALVGGASSDAAMARRVVMITGARGNICTGAALAPDLILTAAHCAVPATTLTVRDMHPARATRTHAVRSTAVHPNYDVKSFANSRATADVALLKLATPLADSLRTPLGGRVPTPGERFIIAGIGATSSGTGAGLGTARAAELVTVGKPSTLQFRLADPAGNGGARAGLGACDGDSGGPVFERTGDRLQIVGVISWSTGAALSAGCGGLTGVTPLVRYRAWIENAAGTLGVTLTPPAR
jgi:secreted trypsin-like serine protease